MVSQSDSDSAEKHLWRGSRSKIFLENLNIYPRPIYIRFHNKKRDKSWNKSKKYTDSKYRFY